MSGITERDLLAPLPLMGDARLPTDAECAWLAGFIDGEGTIGLGLDRTHRSIHVYLTIPNTNLANMARARVLLRSILARDVRVGKPERKDRRPIFVIAIQNQREIKAVVELIRPWLVGKRPQADLMLEYIEAAPSRLVPRSPAGPHRPRAIATGRYTEAHFDFVREMQSLNQRFALGEWSSGAAAATSEWPQEWPDPSLDDRDDELKRWWKLHFGG